jgi:alpha-tubulin suppressor-like RCC1 family protein
VTLLIAAGTCNPDSRWRFPQPVSQERWQFVGHGLITWDGQLGDGTYNNTDQPEQIVASNVTAIAAGGDHSLFLKSNGSLWAMGWNS